MRLRRSSTMEPGWRRRRRGRGFQYQDADGDTLGPQETSRVRALAIPPAWTDVWICPHANGHVQAVGTDAAGRRQYLYHPEWRARRDAEKHDRVLAMSVRLPGARRHVASVLRAAAPTRERTVAAAFRILDLGALRIGSERYLEENHTFGLATLRRDQVSVSGHTISLAFHGKGSIHREQEIVDATLAKVLTELAGRSDQGTRLLAWPDDEGTWHDVTSSDINAYVADRMGGTFTAKDFRTWNATVLMAQVLALGPTPTTERERHAAVAAAYRTVSEYLGNTPTMARTSYVDPRVVDLFRDGVVVPAEALPSRRCHLPCHPAVERAVRRLLRRSTAR